MHVIFRIKVQEMSSTDSLDGIGSNLKIMIFDGFLYDMIIVYCYISSMIFSINVPQTKSVSIAFLSLKSMILGLILCLHS